MTRKLVLQTLVVLASLAFLTHASSQIVAAKNSDPIDDLTILAGISKKSVAAINDASSRMETDLSLIQARLKTQVENLALENARVIELLKLLKEVRSDQQAERLKKVLALREAEAKLAAENLAIAQQISEAKEKAEQAMAQAQTAFVLGIVGAVVTTSGAAGAFGQANTSAFTTLLQQQLPNINLQVLEIRKDVGLTLRIRVGQITSCLSTTQQCNGLSFTNAK